MALPTPPVPPATTIFRAAARCASSSSAVAMVVRIVVLIAAELEQRDGVGGGHEAQDVLRLLEQRDGVGGGHEAQDRRGAGEMASRAGEAKLRQIWAWWGTDRRLQMPVS